MNQTEILFMVTGALLAFFGIFIHEGIHWISLKMLGYNGKFVIIKKYLVFGIQSIGLKDNKIHAVDAIYVTLSPLPFTIIWFMTCIKMISFDDSIITLAVGLFCGILPYSIDIKNSIEIYIWWIRKPNKGRAYA